MQGGFEGFPLGISFFGVPFAPGHLLFVGSSWHFIHL